MKTNVALSQTNADYQTGTESRWVNRAAASVRILLGVLLLFSVTNALFNFAPQPPLPTEAQAYLGGLFSAPYFFGLLKGTELFVGVALLTNMFVPLALVVLAPITLNILLFHAILAPAGMPIAVVLLAFHLATAWSRRESFRVLLAAR